MAALLPLISACNDSISGPSDVSAADGKALNSSVMAELRARAEGCAFSTFDADGSRRTIALRDVQLPFFLPRVKQDPITHRGNGRLVAATARASRSGDSLSINCLVPADVSYSDFASAIFLASRTGSLEYISQAIGRMRPRPNPSISARYGREWQQIQFERLAANPSPMRLSRPGAAVRQEVCNVATLRSPREKATLDIGAGCTCLISYKDGAVVSVFCTQDEGGMYYDSFGFVDTGGWDGLVSCNDAGCGGGADGSIEDPGGGHQDDVCPSCTYFAPTDSEAKWIGDEATRLKQSNDPTCRSLGEAIFASYVKFVDTPWMANGSWIGGEMTGLQDPNGPVHISRYNHNNIPPDYKEERPWDGAGGILYEIRHEFAHLQFSIPQGRLVDGAAVIANRCQ